MKHQFLIEGKEVLLSNLNRILWPKLKITKNDLIKYYIDIAPIALKYWQDRALTITRYPKGVEEEGFYQKNCPDYAPSWINTEPIISNDKVINYLVCNDLPTLVWLGNQAAIEIHPSTYEVNSRHHPSFAIIDLDPTAPANFQQAVKIAQKIRVILSEMGLRGYPKTSGATGIHIYIPLISKYTFAQTAKFVEFIGKLVCKFYPREATNERLIKNRHGVYIDHLQNLPDKTIVGVYSLRPLSNAPISTPVIWEELDSIEPNSFNIKSIGKRIQERGDLFRDVLNDKQSIDHILPML